VPSNGSFTLSCVSTPAAIRYGGGHTRIWLEPSIGSRSPAAIRRIRYRLGYPQLGRKPSSARVNSLFGRERPGDYFQLDVKVAGPKCSNTPPSMTTLAMGSSDCIHRKPSDQPYVLHDVPHHAPVSHPRNYRPTTTPNSHSYLRSQANRRMRPRYIKPRCPVQNGKVERSHRIDEEELLEFPTFAEFSQRSPRLLHPLRHHSHPENHLDPPQLLNTHRHTAILSSDYPTLF
jgi:hypothetical protein